MNVKKIILGLILVLSGCTMAQVQMPAPTPRAALKTFPSAEIIAQLPMGVQRQEAKAQAGASVVVGYETDLEAQANTPKKVKAIVINNPYKTENLEKNNKQYEVDYYLTHIDQADGTIADEELTPLVFENGRLVGKGWEFLNKLK